MELIEAIKQSNAEPIRRELWSSDFAIIPTDGIEACICLAKGEKTAPRWNPSKEDLLADDWVITKMEYFL